MLNVHTRILGASCVERLTAAQNATGERLRFLGRIVAAELDRDDMTPREAIAFFEALLDCTLLGGATGADRGIFDPPAVGNPAMLGRARHRRAALSSSSTFVYDWYFQLQVQAWLSAQGIGPLRDLHYNRRFKGRKACDFAVPSTSGCVELVECKRLQPIDVISGDPLPKTLEKVALRIPEAARQLRETANTLKNKVSCRHAIFDVSAYHCQPREVHMKTTDVTVIGYEDTEIERLKTDIQALSIGDIDKITLCFRNLVIIRDHPCAIIQRASALQLKPDNVGAFDYSGWTVVGFPMRRSQYSDLRVEAAANSLAEVQYTFDLQSNPGKFLKWGRHIHRSPDGPKARKSD
jgi:hypothetical protein